MPSKPGKKKATLRGGHKASPAVSVAIRELLKLREQRRILREKYAMLACMVIAGDGGTAHGYRVYVSHVCATRYVREVRVKEHDKLVFVELKGQK